MNLLPVAVTDQDRRRIRRVLRLASPSVLGEVVAELTRRLERAVHVRSDRIRADVVTLDSQPETAGAYGPARGDLNSHVAQQEPAMHPEYPIERICSHLYEPFQLTFARHAQQMLPGEADVEVEPSHQGLVLRAETEAALERSVEVLQDYYGNQIRVGSPKVRYHNGATIEEPYMGVRVRCLPGHFEAVKADLDARRATILDSELTAAFGVVRATAPLAQLMGYAGKLAQLTSGSAHEVMWLSHYAPVETSPPEGSAA